MPVTSYSYTAAVNIPALLQEIDDDATIVTAVDHVCCRTGNDLDIFMVDALTGAEETALNAVVAAHTNPAPPAPARSSPLQVVSGAPASLMGADDDIAFDPATTTFYRKSSGVWAASIELKEILQGLDASKPAAGSAGRYYYGTDTYKLYYDNGSSWDEVSPSPAVSDYCEFYEADTATTPANLRVITPVASTWMHWTMLGTAGPTSGASDFQLVKFAIVNLVDAGDDEIHLSGDLTAYFTAGDSIRVTDSTGKDGIYSLKGVSYTTVTILELNENLPNFTVDGNVLSGEVLINSADVAGLYEVQYGGSLGLNNKPFHTGLFLNGTLVDSSLCRQHAAGETECATYERACFLTLAQNDKLDLRFKAIGTTNVMYPHVTRLALRRIA